MNDWATRQHQEVDERNQIMDRAKEDGVKVRASSAQAEEKASA